MLMMILIMIIAEYCLPANLRTRLALMMKVGTGHPKSRRAMWKKTMQARRSIDAGLLSRHAMW